MNLAELAEEYGVRNLRFFLPLSKIRFTGFLPKIAFRTMGISDDPVECVVCETKYKVKHGHMITLRALNPIYGKETYYQSDLETMIRNNPDTHKVYVLNIDGYSRVSLEHAKM